MAKPEPALLDPARYPYACEITTRFADMDLNRHLNNVAVAELIEDSRVRFNLAAGLSDLLSGRGVMVASIAVEFLGQAFYPEPVVAHTAVERLGTSSWTTVHLLRQGERAVAFARSVLVCVTDDGAQPLAGDLREQLTGMVLR